MVEITESLELDGVLLEEELKENWLQKARSKVLKNYVLAQVYQAQKRSDGGRNVKVGIIDSGIDYGHEQFQELVEDERLQGINLVKGEPLDKPADTYGHGTQIAGIIAGRDVGIAPQAELYVVKYRTGKDKKETSTARFVRDIGKSLLRCMNYGCDIVNLSIGTEEYDEGLEEVCNELYQQGIVLIASSGNHVGGPHFPACFTESVISVGSIDMQRKYVHSNVWTGKDVVAPGQMILCPNIGNTYYLGDGSSYAAPHVAGIVALGVSALKKVGRTATPDQIREVLLQTASKSVYNLEEAEKFIHRYDRGLKIAASQEDMLYRMFGAGLVRAKKFIEELLL